MECIFIKELNENDRTVLPSQDAISHLRALRLRDGEQIALTNGGGIYADAIVKADRKVYYFEIINIIKDFNESPYRFGLALSILENRERFEFALEKSIELGITDFFPVISEFCQKKQVNNSRLEAKAIAAICQCHRSWLPVIHPPVKLKEMKRECKDFVNILIADMDYESSSEIINNSPTLIFIGPEGGFSNNEKEILLNGMQAKTLNLGKRRLRAETASVSALSVVAFNYLSGIS
jgi:16S rRNA (uracil1498-N3)-methyltransferase